MLWVKIHDLGQGWHPSERLIQIHVNAWSVHELYVDSSFIQQGKVEVVPVHYTNTHTLVELPNETISGARRIWLQNEMFHKESV